MTFKSLVFSSFLVLGFTRSLNAQEHQKKEIITLKGSYVVKSVEKLSSTTLAIFRKSNSKDKAVIKFEFKSDLQKDEFIKVGNTYEIRAEVLDLGNSVFEAEQVLFSIMKGENIIPFLVPSVKMKSLEFKNVLGMHGTVNDYYSF